MGLSLKRSIDVPWDGDFSKLTDDRLKRVIQQLEAAMSGALWMYSQPIAIKVTQELQADSDILEYFCTEDEKDRRPTVAKQITQP